MSGFRCRPEPRAIADAMPLADAIRVRAVLAVAGPDLPTAMATLASAAATLVAERADAALHGVLLAGLAHAIARETVLHDAPTVGSA